MVIPVAMALLLQRCAPNIGSVTMEAIVQYESGWNTNAIDDDTTRRSYYPPTRRAAVVLAQWLLRRGDNIDVGLAQVNSSNFTRFGMTVSQAFAPCSNLRAGARILAGSYHWASEVYGPGQLALWHALEAYNSGRLTGNRRYAFGVFQAAFRLGRLPAISAPLQPRASAITVTAPARTVLIFRRALKPRPLTQLRAMPSGLNVLFESSHHRGASL